MSTTGSTQGQAPTALQSSQIVAPVIIKLSKVNLPEPFNGSQRKLQALFPEVELFFGFNANRVVNEEYKVLFAGSYLLKLAFEWFNTFFQDFEKRLQK